MPPVVVLSCASLAWRRSYEVCHGVDVLGLTLAGADAEFAWCGCYHGLCVYIYTYRSIPESSAAGFYVDARVLGLRAPEQVVNSPAVI